jgi:hypothetical protein
MSRRGDSIKVQAVAAPKSQPKAANNPEMNRKAAEAEIPEGPVKGQDKRGGGFGRDN